MVLPLLISLFAPELIERIVKAREDIIFNLQDWISDCLFAGFICEEADAFDKIHEYMEIMDKFIKAYCFIIPLPILVAYAGEEIMKDPVLLNYFWQFPAVREHLELQASGVPFSFTGYDEELLDNVARLFPEGDKAYKKWKEESGSIFDFFNMIWDTLTGFWQALGGDPMSFVNHVLQECSQTDYPAFMFHIPRELIFILNPFIEIDWAVIKTAIQCYYSFEKYSLNAELAKYPKAFVEGQWIWLEYNGEILAKTELDAEGHFELQGQFEGEFWKDVKINTHGLMFLTDVAELCSLFDLKSQGLNRFINGCDTLRTSLNIFTTPDFEHYIMLWFEDTAHEYPEGFDWNDVFIRIKDTNKGYYEVEIGSYETAYSDEFYFRKKFLCKCEPSHYEEKIAWRGKIDKKTLTII